MGITAKDVNELRKATGAGMMDCKKALVEAEGDIQKAIEILRKKGQKLSAKRQDREANEGAVFVKSNDEGTEAVLIQLNCETDFVARNEDFQALGNSIVAIAQAGNPADIAALKALPMGDSTVADTLTEAIGKMGEKLDLSTYSRVAGQKVVSYIHPGARVGVAVAFDGAEGDVDTVGKDVAMQIAAMRPVAIDKDGVSQELIDKEIEIGMEQARSQGKPEAILEKIARGKLNKYFREHTLLNQDFVKDTSRNVGAYVKDSLGKEAKVVAFKRVQLGEN